jgi:hypothetical protein
MKDSLKEVRANSAKKQNPRPFYAMPLLERHVARFANASFTSIQSRSIILCESRMGAWAS